MNYLSDIIRKITEIMFHKQITKSPPHTSPSHTYPSHKHLWSIHTSCPDGNLGCQTAHFKFLSDQEALDYTKSNTTTECQTVRCWHCHKSYNDNIVPMSK